MAQTSLDIGEVVRRSGLAPSALRFYESRGLIRSIGRRGLRRIYDASVLEHLALIVAAQSVGFEIEELRALLASAHDDADFRRRLAAKAEELDRRIAELTTMRDRLRTVAACPSARVMECPHFRSAMKGVLPRPRARASRRPKAPA